MKKQYTFTYGTYDADVRFIVDTDVFTPEMARGILEFFLWDYDKHSDPIDEVMRKYAMETIQLSTFNSFNEHGVINHFNNKEGFLPINGKFGISLEYVNPYYFDDDQLEVDTKII